MNLIFFKLKKKIINKLENKYHFFNSDKMMMIFLKKDFGYLINKYSEYPLNKESLQSFKSKNVETKNIWIFWWQGIENAPQLVKKCYESVKKHSNNHQVVLVTESNWMNYVDIPEFVINKLNSKKLTLTHFSDILRMSLLYKYGGLWLDATIFVSEDIPNSYFENDYFTIHYSTSSSKITKGKWCGFCQGAKPEALIQSFCLELFYQYWKKYDSIIDYFLIDYAMLLGYENIGQFRKIVDSVHLNNEGIKLLDMNFSKKYDENLLKEIYSKSIFHKLNWKRKYKETTEDGQKTIFRYFIEQNSL